MVHYSTRNEQFDVKMYMPLQANAFMTDPLFALAQHPPATSYAKIGSPSKPLRGTSAHSSCYSSILCAALQGTHVHYRHHPRHLDHGPTVW